MRQVQRQSPHQAARSTTRPRRHNRVAWSQVQILLGGISSTGVPSIECNSPGSPLQIQLEFLVFVLVQQGAHQHPRLWGEFRRLQDALGSLVNHFFRRYDRQFAHLNAMKKTAPSKKGDKANGIDALHPSIKRYQQKQAGIPLSRSRLLSLR